MNIRGDAPSRADLPAGRADCGPHQVFRQGGVL